MSKNLPTLLGEVASRNKSFSAKVPGLQLFWDSTSLGALKECPRKYLYSVVLGFQPRDTSVHLVFGLHYHAAIERYDHARAAGADHEDALRVATRYVLEASWDQTKGRPWQSDDANKNRWTLVRSVVWYLDQFGENDAFQTVLLASGKPAVELSFRLQLDYGTSLGEPFWWCGHLDRVAQHKDTEEIFIMDHKTSKQAVDQKFFDKFNPDNQMTSYTFGGSVVYGLPIKGIVISGAQVLVNSTRFARGLTTRTEGQLEEWLQGTQVFLAQAESYAKAQFWPMQEKSCSNYGGCPFREVCSKPPSMRMQWLQAAFKQRVWDPSEARGEI